MASGVLDFKKSAVGRHQSSVVSQKREVEHCPQSPPLPLSSSPTPPISQSPNLPLAQSGESPGGSAIAQEPPKLKTRNGGFSCTKNETAQPPHSTASVRRYPGCDLLCYRKTCSVDTGTGESRSLPPVAARGYCSSGTATARATDVAGNCPRFGAVKLYRRYTVRRHCHIGL